MDKTVITVVGKDNVGIYRKGLYLSGQQSREHSGYFPRRSQEDFST